MLCYIGLCTHKEVLYVMDKAKLQHFKNKLLKEQRDVNNLLDKMREHKTIDSDMELSSELSFYDNYPGDNATFYVNIEEGRALKEHETSILNGIKSALDSIEEGTYGVCSSCGKDIPEERLEFIPYTEFCVSCQKERNDMMPREKNNRPVEEEVLKYPFGYGYNDYDYDDSVAFDAEDSLQSVEEYTEGSYFMEQDDDGELGYVEKVELISNEQYKNQLPD